MCVCQLKSKPWAPFWEIFNHICFIFDYITSFVVIVIFVVVVVIYVIVVIFAIVVIVVVISVIIVFVVVVVAVVISIDVVFLLSNVKNGYLNIFLALLKDLSTSKSTFNRDLRVSSLSSISL